MSDGEDEDSVGQVVGDAMSSALTALLSGKEDLMGAFYDNGGITGVTEDGEDVWSGRRDAPSSALEGHGDTVGPGDQAMMQTISGGQVVEEELVDIVDAWRVPGTTDVWQITFDPSGTEWHPRLSRRTCRSRGAEHRRTKAPWERRFTLEKPESERREEIAWREGLLDDPETAFEQLVVEAREASPEVRSIMERATQVVRMLVDQERKDETNRVQRHTIVCYDDEKGTASTVHVTSTYWDALKTMGELKTAGVKRAEIYGPHGRFRAGDGPGLSPHWQGRTQDGRVTLDLHFPLTGHTEPIVEVLGGDLDERRHRLIRLRKHLSAAGAREMAVLVQAQTNSDEGWK